MAFSKSSWTAPVSNEKVDITFKQQIKANDALRTGAYSKTLTFTLSHDDAVAVAKVGGRHGRRPAHRAS